MPDNDKMFILWSLRAPFFLPAENDVVFRPFSEKSLFFHFHLTMLHCDAYQKAKTTATSSVKLRSEKDKWRYPQ